MRNVVNEGTADFIASLVLQEPAMRQHTDRWQYGCGNEAVLAARLLREADLKITKPWMFDHAPDAGWPPDMGYWIGYRIAQAYYDRASDKRAALRPMLSVTDFKAYLEASGYRARGRRACRKRPCEATRWKFCLMKSNVGSNEEQIRRLVNDWAKAVGVKDMDGALANHAKDIVMFDLPLPLQSKGIEAYKRHGSCFSIPIATTKCLSI